MKLTTPFCICISLASSGDLFADGIYLYQEPLGALTSYVAPVSSGQYPGVRFETSQSEHISSIQTEMAEFESRPWPSSYFAALVQLPSVTGLPQGNPFAGGEVICTTTFSLNQPAYVWTSLDLPFDITIGPGAYAVVFGSGLFGSSGPIDGLFRVYLRTADSTGFQWLSFGGASAWGNNTTYTWNISVVGAPVPEPSGAAWLGLGGLTLAVLRGASKAEPDVAGNRRRHCPFSQERGAAGGA